MMEFNKPWQEKLNVSQEDFDSWYEQAPLEGSITFWALLEGKLSNAEYLDWARDHYEIPSLQTSFFKDYEPDQQLMEKYAATANWSQELFPVAEWDGVLYVACVEPPMQAEWDAPVQFLLAASYDLQAYWEKIEAIDGTGDAPGEEVPVMEEPPVKEPETSPGLAEALALLGNKDTPPEEPVAEVVIEEAPAMEEPPAPAVEATPEGLNLNFETPAEAQPEGLNLNFENIAPTEEVPAPEAPPAPVEAQTPPTPAAAPAPAAEGEIVQNCDDPEILAILQQLQNDFIASMVLKVEGTKCTPTFYFGQWKPAADASISFDIAQASIFKIVNKSGHPYHGPISSNPINDSFFQKWGFAATPEHVTISPIKSGDNVEAMILCVGKAIANSVRSLALSDRSALALKPLLEKDGTITKAA